MDKKLTELYYDPEFGLIGLDKFYHKVKELMPSISKEDVKNFYDRQEIVQRSKKPIVYKEDVYKICSPPLSFQCDLIYINKALKTGDSTNFYTFLLLVDVCSRKAYIYPIPHKDQANIMSAYMLFLKQLHIDTQKLLNTENEYSRDVPISITSDDGFKFRTFEEYNHQHHVKLDSQTAKEDHFTHGNRLGIIDRLTRTIKQILMKYAFTVKTLSSISVVLDKIIENYNNTQNRGLGNNTPNEVFENKELRYQSFMQGLTHNININKLLDLRIGDTVRIYEERKQFDKERPLFSKEIYTISDIKGNKYKVTGEKGEIKRLFKQNEIQKVNPEAVLKPAGAETDFSIILKDEQRKQKALTQIKR